jgi:hypothetical protein
MHYVVWDHHLIEVKEKQVQIIPSSMQRINLMGKSWVTPFPPTLHDQIYFSETLDGIIFQPLNPH